MEIRIAIRTTDPLTGTVMAGGDAPLNFQGWLELLNALSALIEAGRHPTAEKSGASGVSGLDPRGR